MILVLAGATVLVALAAPAVALAGTYSWSQPAEFTGSSNPEQKYGGASWSYYAGAPPNLAAMRCAGGSCSGGGASIHSAGGLLVISPPLFGAVTLGWSDPFTATQEVSVTGSVTTGVCGGWRLTDQSGNTLAAGFFGGSISASDSLPAGGALYLTVNGPGAACQATVSLTISATTPPVTLTSPADGATLTTGQPVFSGAASSAFDAASTVTVRVYPGPSAAGAPIETVTAARIGSSYAAAPTQPLPNGQYTAQAEQDDPIGQPNTSSPVTFTLNNTAPAVTLDPLGSKPLLTSTPTFTGTAGVRPQDERTVGILIYPGATVSGSPVALASGAVGSDGRFQVRSPSLVDGRYTALAAQSGGGLVGFSPPVTFRIKVHPPALTLDQPAAGAPVSAARLLFSGQAGEALGDSGTVTVTLYRGRKPAGRAFGQRTAQVRAGSWSLGWGRRLSRGTYTVTVTQTDDAGHTARRSHTFVIVPGPTTVGGLVLLSPSGQATIPIGCLAASGTCTGTVLVVTVDSFRTTPGGPYGPLKVMFVYVQIPAGSAETVRGAVPGPVARVLRRSRGAAVRVTVSLAPTGTVSAIRELRLG